MKQSEILSDLLNIQSVCQEIMESNLNEETKYDMIFSEKISRQVYVLFNKTAIHFEYYDPDSSYTEDCQAFYNALVQHIVMLENTIPINPEHGSLLDRFNSL